jgi:hypothetical protein
MNRLSSSTLSTLLVAGLAMAAPAICRAGDISIVFDEPELLATPNGTVTFSANLFNLTASDIDLGQAGVTLDPSFLADPSPFLNGPAVLPANGSTGSFDIFTVTVLDNAAPGDYNGVLSISDINDTLLGTADFTVQITPEVVPEPSSLLLVGLPIALAWRRRARGGLVSVACSER